MDIIEVDGYDYADEILEILNHAISNTTALFDYRPRTAAMMSSWIAAKKAGNYPIMGAIDDAGLLLGFASYGQFRAWPAYKYTVEHSVYVHHEHRRKGIAKKLLAAIMEKAIEQNYHVLVAGIEAQNTASVQLHINAGFQHCGTIHQVGYKFDRWLDLAFYELHLSTPSQPIAD